MSSSSIIKIQSHADQQSEVFILVDSSNLDLNIEFIM